MDKAVQAAKRAFTPGSAWRKMDASDRGVLLSKLADLIDANKHYLAVSATVILCFINFFIFTVVLQ